MKMSKISGLAIGLSACAALCLLAARPVDGKGRRNDLIVWYDFEGDFIGSGVVKDISGNGHDATVTGSVGRADGLVGSGAISFNNTANHYIMNVK